MKDYVITYPPVAQSFDLVDYEVLVRLAKDFLASSLGVVQAELNLELDANFFGVYHWSGKEILDSRPASGWLVCGNIPFLEFNDNEIKTPMEAIALYSWFVKIWLEQKGIDEPEGSIPGYYTAPDWKPLSYSPGFEEHRLGAASSYMAWCLVRDNEDHILHPEIRLRCEQRGWFDRSPESRGKNKG